MIEKELGLR